MELLDIDTTKEIVRKATKIDKNFLIYGEPWKGGSSPLVNGTYKGSQKNENFSVFNQLLLQGIAIGYGSPAIFKEKQMRVIPLQESSYSTYGFMWLKSSVLNAQEKQSMNIISQYVNGPEFILK